MVWLGSSCQHTPRCGDITQIDLPDKKASGLGDAEKVLHGIQGIEFTYFDKSDVVRHKLVSDIINAYDKSELEKEKRRMSKYQNNISEPVSQPIIKEQ